MDLYKKKYLKYKIKYLNLVNNQQVLNAGTLNESKRKRIDDNDIIEIESSGILNDFEINKIMINYIQVKTYFLKQKFQYTDDSKIEYKFYNAVDQSIKTFKWDHICDILENIIVIKSLQKDYFTNKYNKDDFISINKIYNIDYENINKIWNFNNVNSHNHLPNIYNFYDSILNLLKNNCIVNLISKGDTIKRELDYYLNDYLIYNRYYNEINLLENYINVGKLNIINFTDNPGQNPIDDAIFWCLNLAYFCHLKKNKSIDKLKIITNDNQKIDLGKYIFNFNNENIIIRKLKIINKMGLNSLDFVYDDFSIILINQMLLNLQIKTNYNINNNNLEYLLNQDIKDFTELREIFFEIITKNINPTYDILFRYNSSLDKINKINETPILIDNQFIKQRLNDELIRIFTSINNPNNQSYNVEVLEGYNKRKNIDILIDGLYYNVIFKYLQLVYFPIKPTFNNIFCSKYNSKNIVDESNQCTQITGIEDILQNLTI